LAPDENEKGIVLERTTQGMDFPTSPDTLQDKGVGDIRQAQDTLEAKNIGGELS